MKRYLLAVGGTGNKILESAVWAAAADAWNLPEGVQMLSVDVDASCGNTTRAMQRCAQYEAVRTLLDSLPYTHRGFHTPLVLRQWNMDLSRRTQSVAAQTDSLRQGRLLARALFTPEEAALCYSEGFRGHPDLGVLFFADLTAHLDESAAQGKADELALLLKDMEQALAAGEKVKVLLCGSIFGGTGASGIPVLSRLVRERFAAHRDQVELGAVLMLPYYDVPGAAGEDGGITVRSDQFLMKARTALSYYGMEGMVRQGLQDEKGLYDAAFLLGLPQDYFVTTETYSTGSQSQRNDAHLLEWLAVRCAERFFLTDYRERDGANINCYYYQMGQTRLSWEAFDTDAERYRRGYGGLMKAALCWQAELAPELRARLQTRRRLGDRRVGWYAANFRRLNRMPQQALEQLAHQVEDVDGCLMGFTTWMNEVIDSLPMQLRHGRAVEAAQQESRENLRALMEETARHRLSQRLVEERVQASQVSRAQDAEGDEVLRRPLKEQEKRLGALRAKQLTLDAKTGGAFRVKVLEGLLAESQRGLDRAEQNLVPLEAKQRELEALPAAERGEGTLAKVRELSWKETRRRDVFAARRAYLSELLTVEERTRLVAMPPAYDPDAGLPLSELFDPAALRDMRALEKEKAGVKERRAAEEGFARLVQQSAPAPVTFPRLMARLGSGAGWKKDVSPLALLLAQLLENVMQEGKA